MTKFSSLYILEYSKCPVQFIEDIGIRNIITKTYPSNLSFGGVSNIKNIRDFGLCNYIQYDMYYVLDGKLLKIKWCTCISKQFDITNNLNPQKSICNFIDGVLNDSHRVRRS